MQHRLCVGQRLPRVAQHAATSPKYPSPPCLPPCCLCSQALRQSEVRPSLGQECVAEFVGALLPLRPGCSSAAGGRVLHPAEMFTSTFLLLQAPCSVALSVEWGFSASPPPVKLGASTTYYCSPPFRASLEALLWESEFLQLFVLVCADSSPSRCLGLIVGPELTSRFVAGVSYWLLLSSSTCSIKILQLSLCRCIPSLALQWPGFLGSLCC